MDTFPIVAKGEIAPIKTKEGNTFTKAYIGAGWDAPEGKSIDLDLVGACLVGGKLTSATRLIYFGDKEEPGVKLSADNRSGAGDGDDESMTIDFSQVEADVDTIALGLVAYSLVGLNEVSNVKFRIVNGSTASDPQVLEVPVALAEAGDTVLHAANLKRGADGVWSVENVSKFLKSGNNTAAVSGFRDMFL